jgi:hypothetical protein
MYYGKANIYYRKTVGHVFTKPVQLLGKTQIFFPTKFTFVVVHISAAGEARECM